MKNNLLTSVNVSELRIGMYVVLDIGWLRHPFVSSSFKIAQSSQIEVLRKLGRQQVLVDPQRSDKNSLEPLHPLGSSQDAEAAEHTPTVPESPTNEQEPLQVDVPSTQAHLLAEQQRQLRQCEQRHAHASTVYLLVASLCTSEPEDAAHQSNALVNELLGYLGTGEVVIRLLSESAREKSALHSVNVTVLALLLGRAMGVSGADLHSLGMAAFLHDIGKLQLPERARWWVDDFSVQETRIYQDHVALGVKRANAMGLSATALLAIAQHHKMRDGSGFPQCGPVRAIGLLGCILGLVNRYDNLVNPAKASAALTPHEAVATLYSAYKGHYDPVVMAAFIRMMGVYPPGTIVQLSDGRYALVVAVNSSRPLKPRVLVHDSQVPQHEALVVDLEEHTGLDIRRSVRPALVPPASLEYLAPRQQSNYFFEASSELAGLECAA